MMYSGLLSALALFCVVGSIHGLAHMANPPARGTEFGVHPARHVITKTVSYSEYGKYNYEKHPQNCGGWSVSINNICIYINDFEKSKF